MNLQPIKAFIKQRLGLHFAEHAEDSLRRALHTRMANSHTPSAADYLQRLSVDETELHELTSLLTINETYFYREPQHLRLLTETLLPKLLAERGAASALRILSLGCSTGEEPYSIAIALREQYGQAAERLFQINAGDVDRQALKKAQAGCYGAYSFRALPAPLIERYFTPLNPQQHQIDPALRRQVTFRPLNLLAERYPEDWSGQDVVFFRNVSIYFDTETRRTLQQRLRTLLNPGGALIVGATETLPNNFGLLILQEHDGVFFFRKLAPSRAAANRQPAPKLAATTPSAPLATPPALEQPPPRRTAPRSAPPLSPDAAATPSAPPTQADADYQAALALTHEQRFDEALQQLAPLCAGAAPPLESLLLQGQLRLERRDAAGAAAAAQRVLALDPWCADALILQGRIARLRGDPQSAIQHFRQAVYHRPDGWLAHYHLAELYRETDQADLACREYRIVLRQLEDSAQALRAISLLPLAVSIPDLRFLCRTQLSRLGDAAD